MPSMPSMPSNTPAPISELQNFFDKPEWQQEALALRAIALEAGLSEERKWGQPCYTSGGKNIVLVHRLKARIGFAFLRGALLNDPLGLLEFPGENSRIGKRAMFSELSAIQAAKPALMDFIRQAQALADSGQKVEGKAPIEPPEELRQRLDADAELAAAFAALTPGRQRAYCLLIAGAKQATTRHARIDKHRPRILEGKGPNDR